MRCIYINLDRATARRTALEASFAAHAGPGWTLERLAAIEGSAEAGATLSPGERGCFDSHLKALEFAAASSGPALILEDDAEFGPNTCAAVEEVVSALPKGGWDLLFAEAGVGAAPDLIGLLQARRALAAERRRTVIDLASLSWFGSSAYVVAAGRAAAVAGQTRAHRHAAPYDLLLRSLVQAGRLKALVIVPFAMTLSETANRSNIQAEASADLLWNAARRLLWADRDLDHAARRLVELAGPEPQDLETLAVTRLLGRLLAPNFRGK